MSSNERPYILLADSTIGTRLGVASAIAARPELANAIVVTATDAMVGLKPDLAPHLPEATVIVMAYSPIDEELLSLAPKLELIVKGGIGTETIDTVATAAHGVTTTCTPGVNVHGVVEYSLAAILFSLRPYPILDADVREGRWRASREQWAGNVRELRDLRLGIIGLGGIGIELAKCARALGLEVVGCDPVRDLSGFSLEGVTVVSQDELLTTSDYVSVNAILTDDTEGLIGDAEFAMMKPSAVFINAARGGLVDSEALAKALANGTISSAWVDVLEQEPIRPDHPLLGLPNVQLTPHLGGSTSRGYASIGEECARQIIDYLAGRPLDPGLVVSGPRARSTGSRGASRRS